MNEEQYMQVVGKEPKKVHKFDKKEGEPKVESVDLEDVYIRSMYFEKTGEANKPHKHPYGHYTLLATGSCSAELDGEITLYTAPCTIYTPPQVFHKFTALEPNTALHCINVLHEGEPLVCGRSDD